MSERGERAMSAMDPSADGLPRLLDETARAVDRLSARGWIVGGCLRDALLGVPVGDVDLAVTCDPAALANAVRDALPVTIARLRRSVRLGLRAADGSACQLDIAPLHGGEITADLTRRDFTVNALALPLDARDELLPLMFGIPANGIAMDLPHLIDPLAGLEHLRARVLHPAGDSALRDEPGRVLRAARLIASYGFRPSDTLLERAHDAIPLLSTLSPDRVRDELNALLALPRCAAGLRFLAAVGALPALFPTLSPPDVTSHVLASVAASEGVQTATTRDPLMAPLAALAPLRDWYAAHMPTGNPRIVALRWGLLFHAAKLHRRLPNEVNEANLNSLSDYIAASADAESMGKRLSKAEHDVLHKVLIFAQHARRAFTASPDDVRSRRHLLEIEGEAVLNADVAAACCNAALAVAPLEGEAPSPDVAPRVRALLAVFFTDRERLIPPRLLDGADLIRELGMAPGPGIGRMLAEVRGAQLDGQITTRAEALAWARARMTEHGES
jgi:poly(A) polymerase